MKVDRESEVELAGEDEAAAAAPPERKADAPEPGEPDRPLQLDPRMRLEETEALLERLRALPAAAELALDAGAVESLSTPCVLVIAAAARQRAETGRPVVLRSPTAAFVDAFSDLGLFGDLMKMEIRP